MLPEFQLTISQLDPPSRASIYRHKSLRMPEVLASCVNGAFRYESPDHGIRCVQPQNHPTRPLVRIISPADRVKEVLRHATRFWVFSEIRKVRDFRSALCADVWDCVREYSVRVLEMAIAVGTANRGFNDFFPEPVVIHSPRAHGGFKRTSGKTFMLRVHAVVLTVQPIQRWKLNCGSLSLRC